MEKKWWHKSVIYQIYPRSFCDSNGDGIGDLKGIISKLDYLKLLGIDVIWLSPVYASPNDDNGYDISDYSAIHEEYGTMDDMELLIKEARKREICILMDLVANHTSDEHAWFLSAKQSRESPYRNYYIWTDTPNKLQSVFGGSAWQWEENSGQYYLHLFSKKQPDLNWECANMRQDMYQMMNAWIQRGIGGFRMDMIELIGKKPMEEITANGPKLHEYLKEMHQKTFGGKKLLTVGETWEADTKTAKLYCDPAREELDMIFQFEHLMLDQEKEKWDLKKFTLRDLKKVLSRWQYDLAEQGWNSLVWNNHDQPRIVSRWGNDGIYRTQSAKMFATLLHGMKGTPYVYQGEELGMTNGDFETIEDFDDIETKNYYREKKKQGMDEKELIQKIKKKSRDNARTPMQWSKEKNAGFTSGVPWLRVNSNYTKINAEAELKNPDSVFYHYKNLIKLRKENETLVYGEYRLVAEEHPQVFAYERRGSEETLLVVCNFFQSPTDFTYQGRGKVLLSNYKDTENFRDQIQLRPYEAVIYQVESR